MTDYTTTAKVKAISRIKYSDLRSLSSVEFDALIAALITQASAEMDSYTGREFGSHTGDISIYDVGPRNERYISVHGPIITLTKVETRAGKSDTWSELDSDYYTSKNYRSLSTIPRSSVSHLFRTGFGRNYTGRLANNQLTRQGSIPYRRNRVMFWRGYDNVRVTSDYGYATVPTEIDTICILLVDRYLQLMVRESVAKKNDMMNPEDQGSIITFSMPKSLRTRLDLWSQYGGVCMI